MLPHKDESILQFCNKCGVVKVDAHIEGDNLSVFYQPLIVGRVSKIRSHAFGAICQIDNSRDFSFFDELCRIRGAGIAEYRIAPSVQPIGSDGTCLNGAKVGKHRIGSIIFTFFGFNQMAHFIFL